MLFLRLKNFKKKEPKEKKKRKIERKEPKNYL